MNTLHQLNAILVRRRGKVLLPAPAVKEHLARDGWEGLTGKAVIASFNQNIQDLGYTLSPEVMKKLALVPQDESVRFFDFIFKLLKDQKGFHTYRPMYPNFPQQVMDMSMAELYMNAITSYFFDWVADMTGDRSYIWMPKYRKDRRDPLDEKVKLCVLTLADPAFVSELARQLALSNTSLSETDKADLLVLYENESAFPVGVTNKENLAILGAVFFNRSYELSPYFKNATDVLRLAVALSGGDVSLAKPSKFRGFKRLERRRLLSLLMNCWNLEEDMLRHPGKWLRLGERLHPGDYANAFNTVFKAFTNLRNKTGPQTFRSQVEEAVRSGSRIATVVKLLSARPGEFARRLDHIMRKAHTITSKTAAARAFLDVAEDVSTPVLLQVMAHFDHRNESDERTIFPKGDLAKVMSIPAMPGKLDDSMCAVVTRGVRATLRKRFGVLDSLGKTYVDPELKHYLLPFSQRSASKSLRTIVRGSQPAFGFEDKNTVRLFLWWKEPKEQVEGSYTTRVDLDLSAVYFNEDWENLGYTAYTDLKNEYARHSGDVRSAPNGASEFIDIDIEKALANNVRYAVVSVHGYTPQDFCDLPECSMGWMLRAEPQSGEVYDPRTVEDKADLAMAARAGVPFIADLRQRRIIWCDVAMSVSSYYSPNARNDKGTIQLLGKALSNMHKPTVYDLLVLHAKARGTWTTDPDKADTVFSVRSGIQYELERLASDYMADAKKEKAQKATA